MYKKKIQGTGGGSEERGARREERGARREKREERGERREERGERRERRVERGERREGRGERSEERGGERRHLEDGGGSVLQAIDGNNATIDQGEHCGLSDGKDSVAQCNLLCIQGNVVPGWVGRSTARRTAH